MYGCDVDHHYREKHLREEETDKAREELLNRSRFGQCYI